MLATTITDVIIHRIFCFFLESMCVLLASSVTFSIPKNVLFAQYA